jgi:hypothetical protein
VALVGLLLLAAALLWLFRASIAANAAQSWCRSQALSCDFEIDALGLDGAGISGVRIETEKDAVPFEADRLEIDLGWDGLFSPVIRRVDVARPILRLEYTSEGKISLGGLETLTSGDREQTNIQMPRIGVTDARIEATTPAGLVVMRGTVSAQLPYQAEIHAEIEPADLETDRGRLNLEGGRAHLSLAGPTLSGSADLLIGKVVFDTLSAENIVLDARMAESLRPRVEWELTAGSVDTAQLSGRALELSGSTGINTGGDDDKPGVLNRIRSITANGTAGALSMGDISTGDTQLVINAKRTKDQPLSGEFALDVSDLDAPQFAARNLKLSGTGRVSDDMTAINASGDIVLNGAGVAQETRNDMLSAIGIGSPFGAHAAALGSGLSAALADFQTGTGYTLRYGPDADWSLVSTRAIALQAANSARISLTPSGTRPVFNLSGEAALFSGVLSMQGPQLPSLTADVSSMQIGGIGTQLDAGGVSIKPWSANGLNLSGDLNQFNLDMQSGAPRIRMVGEVRLTGQLFGQTFEPTTVFGGVDALMGESLRVQSFRTRCIGIDSGGVGSGENLSVGSFSAQLCPQDGRLVRSTDAGLGGRLSLSDLTLPFQTEETSGTLSLREGHLDWRAASTASLSITARQMSGSFSFGKNTLELTAAEPTLGLQTTSPLSFSSRTGQTRFGGSVIPADVSLASLQFDATLPESGLLGSAVARGVEVRDQQEDPFYEPLAGTLTAAFSNGLMQLSGPVKTLGSDRTVADINLTLDLVGMNGEASIDTPDLIFAPRGFQPTELSERVRGFLSNARGQLNAGAKFDINGGDLSGIGYVEVKDFGFDTLRVGAVDGVNGRVRFDDLLGLHTPPGQTVQVGAINPGLPLNDGVISFQMLAPTNAIIERAAWPFAGGQLVVGRSEWTIAGTRDIIEITASQLELTRIINIFDLPDIEANGTVSGRFPVELSGPNTFIRDAVLEADEDGGTIAYTGDIADAASQADERVNLAFRALKDFRFSVLEVGVTGNLAGSILVTVELIGKSPDVLGGAPFAFNIGVDSELMKLIRTGRSMTGTDWLAEVTRTQQEDEEEAADGEVDEMDAAEVNGEAEP